MKDLSFSKIDTQIAKGIAIFLMVYHHLFAYNRLPLTYISFLPTAPIDLTNVLSEFGNICVSIFMLLTGIGLYHVSKKANFKQWSFSHLIHFVLHYWIIFFLFVPVGFLLFGKQFIWTEFLSNLFLFSYSYNLEWWYLRVYLEILLLSPWIVKYILKGPKISIFVSFVISFVGYLLRQSYFDSNIIAKELSTLFLWQFIFCIGFLIANFHIFEKITRILLRSRLNKCWFSLFLIVVCIILRQEPYITEKLKDPIIAPLFLYFGVNLSKQIHIENFFSYLGKHSLNIWLIHTFFCYYYLTDIVLLPRFSLLILIWLLLLSLGASHIINMLEHLIMKGLKKWKKNRTVPNVIF